MLENDIDAKLLSFSKMTARDFAANSASAVNHQGTGDSGKSGASLTKEYFERMSKDIETLLNRLTEINNKMSQSSQHQQNASSLYTIQRHREILNDYANEFRKTKSKIETQLDRDILLGIGNSSDSESVWHDSKVTDPLLKENDHIRSSEIMIDEQIGVATRTRETLMSQRNAMKAIQTQMTNLANRFPVINNLMHRINLRKRRDSVIIGCVTAVCLFLLLLYIF